LRERVVALNLENQALKEAAREVGRLKSLLGLPALPGFEPLAARVIGMEPAHPPTEITVNRGAREGVRRNLPAVNPFGLVGKVLDATPDAAVVQLLFDPGCRVAARDQRSRVLGIVKWKSGPRLSLENVSLGDDVLPGDTLVSSGLGGIFPEGLLIGTILSVKADSTFTFKQIEIEPAVRFSALDEIFILLPKGEGVQPREW
jgi:rod shape-determining protein MreC